VVGIPKYKINGPFNYAEQNGNLKILIECLCGKKGCERIFALQSLSTFKKGTGTFSFQSNEPFQKVLRQTPSVQNASVKMIYTDMPKLITFEGSIEAKQF